ncbi:MAG: hypothetical protein PHD21_02805 [Flavobacteriales bacterium]|nr:hypothetical protein [Flavobacteriales bacterium]
MKAPKIPSFIRQSQHNDYTPRYRFYDPAKERREQRERLYGNTEKQDQEGQDKEGQDKEGENSGERLRDTFRSRVDKNRHVKKGSSSSRSLAIFILVILALVLWMLKTDFFEKIMTSFMNM